jgi:outer membrane protein TolC
MTNIERAREHAEQAEKQLEKAETWKTAVAQANGARATAHAMLALYYRDLPEQ